MRNFRLHTLAALALAAPLLMGLSCSKAEAFKTGKNLLGVVQLGPFPKTSPGVAGYNLYLAEKKEGPWEKINAEPVLGFSSIMVPMLDPGKEYWFRMTSVSAKDPKKESAPGGAFKRTAVTKN